jgi:hypothetical protein
MQHIEQHFSGSATVRDVVIGMADGLTVRSRWRRVTDMHSAASSPRHD